MSQLEDAGVCDVRPTVTDAARVAVNAARRGISLAKLAQQQDIDLEPNSQAVVRFFAQNARSARRMGEGLQSLAERAYAEATRPEAGMFGPVERRSREEVIGEWDAERSSVGVEGRGEVHRGGAARQTEPRYDAAVPREGRVAESDRFGLVAEHLAGSIESLERKRRLTYPLRREQILLPGEPTPPGVLTTGPHQRISFRSRRADRPVRIKEAMVGRPLGDATRHPDYVAAKAGDVEAALRLAEDLVSDDLMQALRQQIGEATPIVVPVVSVEATGRNKIPQAVAAVVANHLGLRTEPRIAQATLTRRTSMDGLDRLLNPPEFDGMVEDSDYLLVDDTITQGGTLAALASHIEQAGGRVVSVFALTGKQYSRTIQLSSQLLDQVRAKFAEIEDAFRAVTGYGFGALTESEARYLAKHDAPQSIRDRLAAPRGDSGRQADEGSPRQEGEVDAVEDLRAQLRRDAAGDPALEQGIDTLRAAAVPDAATELVAAVRLFGTEVAFVTGDGNLAPDFQFDGVYIGDSIPRAERSRSCRSRHRG